MPRFGQLTPAEQLNELTGLALQDFYGILAVPLHMCPASEWPMWLRAKVRAGAYVLSAKLRVDEASPHAMFHGPSLLRIELGEISGGHDRIIPLVNSSHRKRTNKEPLRAPGGRLSGAPGWPQ
jgi:hypothetical protein